MSDGLHQAIEAKEGANIQAGKRDFGKCDLSRTIFRLYDKLAGMTGTAVTEAEEFSEIYGLGCDCHSNQSAGQLVLTRMIGSIARHVRNICGNDRRDQKGAMPLVSRFLLAPRRLKNPKCSSDMLGKEGVEHNVLNARQHEKEAQIVADAGKFGAVTIATNMGRPGH